MYVAVLVGFLAMLFAYLESNGGQKNGLKIAFGIITLYLAIRYDYGNDYMNYLNSFYRYQSYSGSLLNFEELKDMQGHGDFGWVILCLLFKTPGFFAMIIALAIFQNWVIYDFVKTYVPKKWYPFAIFIYVFNPNIMVLGGSMMRQWLAICIFIFAFRFIRDKKPIHYFACIIIAMAIHGSAKILFLVYFVTYLKNYSFSLKSLYWFIPTLVAWFVVAPQLFLSNMDLVMSGEDMDRFTIYSEGTGEKYGILGVVAAFLFPVVCISQINKFDPKYRLLILIFFCSILIRPLGLVIGMILRMNFYFITFSIVVFPMVMDKINNLRKEFVYLFILIIAVPTLRDFYGFFHADVWIEHYMHYQTIFRVPWQ